MKYSPINRRSFVRSLCQGACAATALSVPVWVKAAAALKIGFLGPLSGPLARVAETNRNCLSIAIQEINATGGLLGQSIEMVVEDTHMSTKGALDKARKLFLEDDVSVITGMVLPFEREAVLQAAGPARRLVIYPNFDEGRCHPQLLTTGLTSSQRVEPMIGWVAEKVGKRVYLLMSDIGSNRRVLVPQIEAALKRHGGALVGTRFFPFGTRDFAPTFQQLRSLEVDAIWHSIGDDPITFVKQYRSFQMKPQLVTDITHESIALATEGASAGTVGVSPYFMSIQTDANKRFLDAYTRTFPDSTPLRIGGNVVMLPHGESTYVGAKLYAEAVRLAASTSLEKVKQALLRVSADMPRGTVRVSSSGSHLQCATLLGRCRPDSQFEVLGSFGPVPAVCESGS